MPERDIAFTRFFNPRGTHETRFLRELRDFFYRNAIAPQSEREDVAGEALSAAYRSLAKTGFLVTMYVDANSPSDQPPYSELDGSGTWHINVPLSRRLAKLASVDALRKRNRQPQTVPWNPAHENIAETADRDILRDRLEDLRVPFASLSATDQAVLWTCSEAFDSLFDPAPFPFPAVRFNPVDRLRAIPERLALWAPEHSNAPVNEVTFRTAKTHLVTLLQRRFGNHD